MKRNKTLLFTCIFTSVYLGIIAAYYYLSLWYGDDSQRLGAMQGVGFILWSLQLTAVALCANLLGWIFNKRQPVLVACILHFAATLLSFGFAFFGFIQFVLSAVSYSKMGKARKPEITQAAQ
jgi:Na+/H+-dicarboxylate symporter